MNNRRKLRVLTLVAYPGTFGGGERLASEITLRLDRSRYERTICVSRWPGHSTVQSSLAEGWRRDIEAQGVETVLLSRETRGDLLAWRPILKRLRRGEFDVIHSHMFGSNATGAALGRAFRVPVVVAHEHSWSFSGRMRSFLDRHLIARLSDAFVAVSRADAKRMVELEGIPSDKVRLIPNGIDTPPEGPPISRESIGVPSDAYMIVAVGVLRIEKAYQVLIEATARLRDRIPNAHLVIVGPDGAPPTPDRLRALVAERGLQDVVGFLGPRLDIAAILGAADVAVCSSEREGSPLTVMEYMAAGLPVVSTRVGGVPDIVTDGETGLLVEPHDPDSMASAIERLAADPDEAARLGAAGRLRRASEFTIDATVARVEELYEELYATSSRAR